MCAMRTLGNILWFFLAGWELFLGYAIAGVIAFILIITIPFGVASFRIAGYVVWPFGRTVVAKPSAGLGSAIGNVIWLVLFGWWLALIHIVTGLLLGRHDHRHPAGPGELEDGAACALAAGARGRPGGGRPVPRGRHRGAGPVPPVIVRTGPRC